jgi:hypothetical protein
MEFTALTCPQCGGSLPRAAHWRMVACPYCRAMVTRSTSVVEAKAFHQAWQRSQVSIDASHRVMRLEAERYLLLAMLGSGNTVDVYLAQRLHVLSERVVVRRAKPGSQPGSLRREYETLIALQAFEGPGAAYYSQRLPQAISYGLCGETGREILVTRNIPGCWGSLSSVLRFQPGGIDPRHGIWIWRRMLDTLGFVHAQGWSHGDIHPGHVLVQPTDHGAFLIGWGQGESHVGGKPGASAHHSTQADDLVRAAWCIRVLLHGLGESLPGVGRHTPRPLAELMLRASEDKDWCSTQGAQGIDSALKSAARESFGPPRFHHFDPMHAVITSGKDGC